MKKASIIHVRSPVFHVHTENIQQYRADLKPVLGVLIVRILNILGRRRTGLSSMVKALLPVPIV